MKVAYTNDGIPYYVADDVDVTDNTNLQPSQEPQSLPIDQTVQPQPTFDKTPFEVQADALKRATKRENALPVADDRFKYFGPDNPERPSYIMEPDLLETQSGLSLPPSITQNDAGQFFYRDTGEQVPVVRRPNMLPLAKTPEGVKFVVPKMLDLVGNVMSPMVAGKVPVNPGEVVLGSGPVRTMSKTIVPSKENLYDVVNSNFDYGKVIGSKTVPIDTLIGGTINSPAELKRVDNLVSKISAEDGFIERLIVDDAGKVIEGQHRLDALKKLGIKNVPVTIIQDLGRNFDISKVKTAIKNTGIHHSDQINQIVRNNLELFHENKGDINKIFNEYDLAPYDKAALNILRSDTSNQVTSQALHQLEKPDAMGFYSALQNAVKQAKPTTATADQWLGYLKNQPGVKSEELNYVLKELPQGQITKQELEGIVDKNKVQLNDVWKGRDNKLPDGYEPIQLVDKSWAIKTPEGKNTNVAAWRTPEAAIDAFLRNKNTPTKFHQYQLPGGDNYKELLMTSPSKLNKADSEIIANNILDEFKLQNRNVEDVPNDELQKYIRMYRKRLGHDYISSHWDEPNPLVHVRVNDRVIDGKKVLNLEEIQSDWHQLGRKSGYKLEPQELKRLQDVVAKVDDKLTKAGVEDIMGHPNLDQALKMAVERKIISQQEAQDYTKLTKNENATTPDAPFKSTWADLAIKRMIKHASENGYDAISWTPGEAQAARYDLSKYVDKINLVPYGPGLALKGEEAPKFRIDAFKDNKKIIEHFVKDEDEVARVVGKDVARKLFETRNQHGAATLAGQDLKVGGEGMIKFYNKMLVDKFNALGKKYGVKVEERNITVNKGKPTEYKDFDEWSKAPDKKSQPIHYFKLTPELKSKALNEGFPLFSSSPVLTPIQGDPFKDQKKKFKLTPIPGNPFQ